MPPTLTLPRYSGLRLAILVVAVAVAAMLVPNGGKVVAQGPLTLADFDATGKEVVLLALIEAGAEMVSPGTIRYQSPPRSPVVGSLVAGGLGIGPDNAVITRIWFLPSVRQITINHNTQGFGFTDYLGLGGAGNDLTAHIQTLDGSVAFPAAGRRLGGSFANYVYPEDAQGIISGVGTGDRFILAFYRDLPPPAQASGVEASALSATEISVSWSAAANADGYLVQWATTGQAFDAARQASVTGTSHTISGLEPNTDYYVQVIATRIGAANGPPSAPPAPATTNALSPPAQVSSVQASALSDTEISVSWSAAANADGYLVQWTTAGQSFDDTRQASVTGTTHTITGLQYSTEYFIRVAATRTGAANGPPFDPPATATTNAPPTPAQVSGVQASALSDTAISVSWSAAANADGYLVQWATGDQSFDAARQASVTGTSHTITGLRYSADYRIQVIATRTGAANGPPSQSANARTNPLLPPAQVSGVQASAPSDTEISVSWSAAANADGYLVQWAGAGRFFHADRQASVTGTTYTITGLEHSTAYLVRVVATRTDAANGPPSQSANARTNPPPPPAQVFGVHASALSDAEISVSWSAAANATAYVVEWRPDGESHAADRRAVVSGTEVIVEGLESETEYFIRVFGTRRGAANGPASAEDSAVTLESAFKSAIKRFPGGNEVAMQMSLVAFAGVLSGVRFRGKKSPQREAMVLGFMCAASLILPIIGIGSLFWTGGIVLLIAAATAAMFFLVSK